jgi:CRISPR-associated protein Csx17
MSLEGIRPEPLASYLAALGVLRLVGEQQDPGAEGWFRQEQFHLRGNFDTDALASFFLHHYRPTPIASPWNAGGGFFHRSADSAVTRIECSEDRRFESYRQTLQTIDTILKAHRLEVKPSTAAIKLGLVRDLHANLPLEARRYLDAVLTFSDNDVSYHSLFISGGNDGRVDFAKSFMDRLVKLLLDSHHSSESLLRAALFDTLTEQLEPLTAGPHHPGSTGGPNASSEELEARPLSNPWTYILAMEGALLLEEGPGHTLHRDSGYPSAIPDETRLRDLWLPLWSTPRTLDQVKEAISKPEHHTLRYSFLPRNGRGHFALPVERRAQPLQQRPAFVLELERQLAGRHTRDLQAALTQEPLHAGHILEHLGTLDWQDEKPPKLPQDWIAAADDSSHEFRCALALSGLGRGLHDLDLKLSLQHFVGRDLCEKMLNLLRARARRATMVSMRPTRGGYPYFNAPFWSTHPATPTDLEAFLCQRLDERRVERLFRGLALVESPPTESPTGVAFLPFPFTIARLAFHQRNDRRPAPIAVANALVANSIDQAIKLATSFLTQRHPGFPQLWARSAIDNSTARRWAAALLLPISDATYDHLLERLHAS